MDPGLQRHIDECNNAVLPGGRRPFLIGSEQVGWVRDDIAAALAEYDAITDTGDAVVLNKDMASDLPAIVEAMGDRGLVWFRGEEFDVRARPDGPVLSKVDRGALPKLGIQAAGVHVNGLVRRPSGIHVWVARRAADKKLDPGKLDHIVAGGISAGMTPQETLLKEAGEEAGIASDLAVRAVPVTTLSYTMDRPEGLRRDVLYCYDLELPPGFTPVATDGEVESFELWEISRALEAVKGTDDFKFNVSLVLVDLFKRLRLA